MSIQNKENLLTSKSDVQNNKGALSLNRVFIITVISLTLLGVLIGYFLYTTSGYQTPALTDDAELTPVPYGTLMFTASSDDVLGIYSFNLDVEGGTLKKFDTQGPIASTEFTDKFNPTTLYFSASTIYTADQSDQGGLHSWDLSSSTIKYYKSVVGNMERDINFSPSTGLVAFSRLRESIASTTEPRQIDDYEVVIMDPAQDVAVEIIQGGLYPRWSPTGKTLLYLTKDGLYTFDLSTLQGSKVIGPNELGVVVTPSTAMDVSVDGKQIVITSQGSGGVTVFDVDSWSPLTLQVASTLEDPSKFYFNPVISPDGAMYAVIVTDKVGDIFINPRFEVRAMQYDAILFSESLDDFDPEKIYIDDWIVGAIVFSEEGAV